MKFRAEVRAPKTRRDYACDWRGFEAWCCSAGRSPRPATEETVTLYLTESLRGHRVTTCQRRLAAIRALHRDAGFKVGRGSWPDAVAILRGAQRQRREQPEGREPVTPKELRRISARLAAEGTARGARDRALMVFGFASGLRRSNLAALQMGDVYFERRGVVVSVTWSKTDQEGEGSKIGVRRGRHEETCPVRALRAWLKVRGCGAGPLFSRITTGDGVLVKEPISGDAIADVVKRAVASIGLDPAAYGAHSLRAGCATAAATAGAPAYAIMRRTGHQSEAVMRRYIRGADPFGVADPLAGVL